MRAAAWLALALLAACRTSGAGAGAAAQGPKAELSFRGGATFQASELERAVALDVKDLGRRSSPKAAIEDAAYTLVEFYRSQGFPDCAVDYELTRADAARVAAEFSIVEGPRTRLARVEVGGNRFFSERELLALLGMGGLERASAPRWYVERELAEAADALASHYASEGFLDVQVEPPALEFDADRTSVRARLVVREGPRYTVLGAPALEGGLAEIDAALELREFAGRPLTPRLPLDLRGRIEEAYLQRGRPDVEVELRQGEPDAEARVPLTFAITPGPEVRVSEVRVTGNDKTRRKRVSQLVTLEAGERYDVREVRESFRQLYRSGLFQRVRIELEPGGGPERALEVEVEEATSTELYFEPGYGSYEGLRASAGWRETNLFGGGRTLSLDGMVAQRASRVVAGLSDRRAFDSPYEAGVSVYQELREEPSYDKDELGAALTVSREYTRRVRVSAEYRLRSSDVSNVDLTDPVALAEAQDVDISSLTLSGNWDRRDSIFLPTDGNLARLSVEYASDALGSELEFTRVRWTESWFVAPRDGTVLALSWRGGVIVPLYGTDSIPLQERFFNGGENTVRSYAEDELGPKDPNGNPLGGEGYQVLSLELRQRLRGALEGALFWDAGSLAVQAADLFRFDEVGHALGAGVRYALPIGPLRLDVAWNPDAQPDEDTWRAHFSVGMAF